MATKSCGVCCEPFNLSSRKKVECNYCDFEVCTNCTEMYLLDSAQDPHCMNCRHAWNRDIMETVFTKKFYTVTYQKHRGDIMFQRQLSLMPETQQYVGIEQSRLKYVLKVNTLKKELKERKLNYKEYVFDKSVAQMPSDEYVEYVLHKCSIEKHIKCLELDIQANQTVVGAIVGKVPDSVAVRFVRACPATDCKGFLSSKWKCGLCDVDVCAKCHEIKLPGEEHVCNADSLATAALLSKDTKPCPKCAAFICKINGCDQMWCTQCHTAFSWRTGKTEEHVHNPHYYDYMRRNGGVVPRPPGDVPGGGICNNDLPPISVLLTWMSGKKIIHHPWISGLPLIHRLHVHINRVELPRYQQPNMLDDNRDLRIKYMLNVLPEEKFKAMLHQHEKAADKKREILMVLQTYQAITVETLIAMVNTTKKEEVTAAYERMLGLRAYVNESLEKISKRYGNVAPLIGTDWNMTSTGIEKKKAQAA